MITIAIVEDEPQQLEQYCDFARQYQVASGHELSIQAYTDGDELLDDFRPGRFHILLLDIQMKRVDGMTTAKKVRARDENVIIMFITNIVQYAVKGYSVQALDFIVKPVDYGAFSQKLELAIRQVQKHEAAAVSLKLISGFSIFKLDEIVCVEIVARKLFIHTVDKSYSCNETLQGIEEKLHDERFFRCHAAYLVNLQHVRQINNSDLYAAHRRVPVSRHRHKELMDALTRYLGK